MSTMKSDMSGGAAVLEAIGAIARLGLPVDVIAVIGATENLPGGPRRQARRHRPRALGHDDRDHQHRRRGPARPVPTASTHAREQGAERLVDVATLTGGDRRRARLDLRGAVRHRRRVGRRRCRAAGERAGERYWRLPLDEEYADAIKGRWSDIVNANEDRKALEHHRRRVPAPLRRRRPVGAPRHRRRRLGLRAAPTRPRAARASRRGRSSRSPGTPRGRPSASSAQARRKCSRRPVAVPNPHARATCSTGTSVSSSSAARGGTRSREQPRAAASCRSRRGSGGRRCAASSRRGAPSSRRSAARSRRSSIHARVGARPPLGRAATGRSTNCAWPPARCGATTMRRATRLASASAPRSRRTMCRHRSMPAATPADVSTSPSST